MRLLSRSVLWAPLLCASVAVPAQSQPLPQQLDAIARESQGKLQVACAFAPAAQARRALPCNHDAAAHAPMQSVFKLPLAIYVVHQVELGKLTYAPDGRLGVRLDTMHGYRHNEQMISDGKSPFYIQAPSSTESQA